ncbi:hypothetical protein KGF57_000351 [Candida theae]|uniref:Uncharacterized protein n=1 Tax=Candida theae TaxID=1198502 RepID=A0AAD5BJ53_9ASCO|nr:uncharacterized protein KGF57_000351 [Candida theae]KAI5967511.1 hypothetical protein KGF57_000351 [Candida theae]
MATLDNEVNIAWIDSYIEYTRLKDLTPDERILEKKQKLESKISQQQQKEQQSQLLHQSQSITPGEGIDISLDAPNLVQLIEFQENGQDLTKELKNLLIKYYWAGFELNDKLREAEMGKEARPGGSGGS